MVSAVKWEASPTSRSTLLTTELNSLANNAISAAGTELDNSTNLDLYGWLVIDVTFGSAPSDAAPTLDLYLTKALDGTNYESSPVTSGTDCGHQLFRSVPVRKTTSAQKIVCGPLLLPPCKFKLFLDNQTGVAFPASGSTVTLYTDNPESQ